MKYLLIPDTGKTRRLPFWFAMEEYVAQHFTDDDYCCLWQVGPTVMLGRNQNIYNELDADYCKTHGIDIFRRKSGGGCVYADGGCLQFSYIVHDANPVSAFAEYMQTVEGLLRGMGIEASTSGRNDLVVEGHKVAGAAFYVTRTEQAARRLVMHNTLLYNTDLDVLQHVLTPSAEKMAGKGVASVRQRVGNVADYTDMPLADFVALARQRMSTGGTRMLTDSDLQAIALLERDIASDAFVYGHTPGYGIVRRCRIPEVGLMEAHLKVSDGTIRDLNFTGDFFLIGDLDKELIEPLKGIPFTREAVQQRLQDLDLAAVVRHLTAKGFLDLLFGAAGHVRKPEWLKMRLGGDGHWGETHHLIQQHGLHTICQSGLCPNRNECWSSGTATFMIGGDICTRNCRFCNTRTGHPLPLDPAEPDNIAQSVAKMQLRYAVITSVDRDDLPDLGAAHWAETVRCVRRQNPDTKIELLIPDFQGRTDLLDIVLSARPDVIGHNMETTRQLTPSVRSRATYNQSLDVLRYVADHGVPAKTGFMVGLGESDSEIAELMADIYATGCRRLTIGQYLQPTPEHAPLRRYVTPAEFDAYRDRALQKGFKYCASTPLVRSSYRAAEALDASRAGL